MPHIEVLQPGFSTADASYPEIRAVAGVLRVTFTDWQTQAVSVRFDEVCAFRWQEAEALMEAEPYDGSCELHGSDWVTEHVKQAAAPDGTKLRHLRFNFNASGKLEVLCTSFSVEGEASG